MKPKEIDIIDEANYPHLVLKCLSCSLLGVELDTFNPESDTGYTQNQLNLIEKITTTHARKHTNAKIRLYNYQKPSRDGDHKEPMG